MEIDFEKSGGLVPAVVQDVTTGRLLMVGYMNQEALTETRRLGQVTFWSRSKKRLWTKGETSGHFLTFHAVKADCDGDALLVYARPTGPVCHTGSDTCFGEGNAGGGVRFLDQLKAVIRHRRLHPDQTSYTASLFRKGINKIAQKVGEEAVELVIEAKDNNDELFRGEAADLLFHLLVLLEARNVDLDEVMAVLEARHQH